MPTKSSHSPRAARRGSARKRADANRSRRSRTRPKAPAAPAAPPAPPAPVNAASPIARAEPSNAELTKREIEVRRIPLARPFLACPRCDNNHESLEVKRLTRPADGFSHFAMCPNLGEPILIAMGGA